MKTLTHPSLESPASLLQACDPILKRMPKTLKQPARHVTEGRTKTCF